MNVLWLGAPHGMVNLVRHWLEGSPDIKILETSTVGEALGIVVEGRTKIDKIIFGDHPENHSNAVREIVKRLRGKAIFLGASSHGNLADHYASLGIPEFTPNNREAIVVWIARRMPGT